MLDFSTYLAAQHLTRGAVTEALPEAPIRPDRVPVAPYPNALTVRQWLSLALRSLADVIEASSPRRAGSAMRTASVHGGCC
jgi:hypothetical protein